MLGITHLLSLDIKSLTVVGFDFYQTLYLNRTDEDHRLKIMANKKGTEDGQTHNPLLQLKYIKDNYYIKDNRFIPLGVFKKLLDEE